MVSIESVATALPPHRISQAQAAETARRVHAGREDLQKLLRVFPKSGVQERRTAFPPEYYATERSFDERNRDFIQQGLTLAEKAARACLEKAKVKASDIDHLYLVTTTGLATPSLDAMLVGRLGLRGDVRRWPLFGLGCAGGAGALTRACDVLDGSPRKNALVIAVELCGQVFSTRASTPTDIIGAALFGDGAAAALVGPGKGPRIVARRSVLYAGTEHLMGWAFTSDGMRLILSREVTTFVGEQLRPVIATFLRDHRLSPKDIAHWVLHPGGRRILETYHEAFGLGEADLRWTRGSLARVGNLSSASVLFILSDLLESGTPKPGERGLMCALGPGFASELLLLEW
ncbi:MAG TPA: 3-oxoacyl-[acyl-carrier-protein] synthase III C-terminal domain-containing protein [Planctomycetota bacterium]|nr:3-oxoacyl-[acyl-carrier-protein] synthase III C-terminal domain-containing protein [Planctomycetota bacterium]